MEDKTIIRLSELIKMSGYLIAGGALVGFSVGIYRVFNHAFFGFFVQIAEFEAVNYFLAVFMPSFVILIIIGYLFTTTSGFKELKLSNAMPLCLLSLTAIVLSALSIFYFISLFGGLFILIALVRAYAKPSFTYFSTDLAFFFVEIGAMFVAAFSTLFFLMWAISSFFVTYAVGFLGSYSPMALFLVGVLSITMFLAVPIWGSNGANSGISALIGFSLSFLWYVLIIQSQYVMFSAPAFIGVVFLFIGSAMTLAGNLMYLSFLFFSPTVPIVPSTSILFKGKYCPNCGSRRTTAVQKLCLTCRRDLMWTPLSPFCSACGKVVPSDSQACPHCFDDIRFKRNQFELAVAHEHETAFKLSVKPKKKPSMITAGVFKVFGIMRAAVMKPISILNRMLNFVLDWTNLTSKDVVFMIILTYVFAFVAFIGYVRVESAPMSEGFSLVAFYGFPAEWLRVSTSSYPFVYNSGLQVMLVFLIADVILYFSAAFLVVYGIQRFRQ